MTKFNIPELKSRVNLVDFIGRYVQYTPKKTRKGMEHWACCPFHHEATASFSVRADRQVFSCLGCDAKGDVITFIELIERVDRAGAIRRLAEIAGGGELPPAPPQPDPRVEARRLAEQRKRAQERARQTWNAARRIVTGDPVDCYLRGRGLEPGPDGWSPMLRFIELDYSDEVDGTRKVIGRWPVMLAAVTTGLRLITCHRTYIDPDRPGRKAPVTSAKKLMGSPEHGAIRLEQIDDDGMVVAGEGIETVLTCRGLGFGAAISGISLGHMAGRSISASQPDVPDLARPGLIWPAGTRHLILLRDADAKDVAKTDALLVRAARRATAAGIDARIASPPEGMDFNDWLQNLKRANG